MSTFNGIVKEFPRIRIDYFRSVPDHPPPLACFLSHIHSDHLAGLESKLSTFIYCTPATREILLRLEKYPHRVNFAKGILESRKQTYRHLSKLLKTIPLEVPTKIELAPGKQLCVTLFDANHCVGACMFLIQDDSGTAVMYTGDIRSETWFVNSLVENPLLIPYTLGSKRLSCIYLDTTFATKSDIHRNFQSKAEGLHELIEKVSRYPEDTIFYFQAWTFGYEHVWIALAAALGSQVHLDNYRWRIYNSLTSVSSGGMPEPREAAQLCGYMCGNHRMPGCLTTGIDVRIHSCEKGNECHVIKGNSNAVKIVPIITRTKEGIDVLEPGAGGGLGDLSQVHELELLDPYAITQLMALCALNIKDQPTLAGVLKLLTDKFSGDANRLRLDTEAMAELEDDEEDLPIYKAIPLLQAATLKPADEQHVAGTPKTITFPFSRHSSYSELIEFVAAFRPLDVHPCTVDEGHWTEDVSMRTLFGEHCSADIFAHDRYMRETLGLLSGLDEATEGTQRTEATNHGELVGGLGGSFDSQRTESDDGMNEMPRITGEAFHSATLRVNGGSINLTSQPSSASTEEVLAANNNTTAAVLGGAPPTTQTSAKRKRELTPPSSNAQVGVGRSIGRWAYEAAAGLNGMSWEAFGGLECTTCRDKESQEL